MLNRLLLPKDLRILSHQPWAIIRSSRAQPRRLWLSHRSSARPMAVNVPTCGMTQIIVVTSARLMASVGRWWARIAVTWRTPPPPGVAAVVMRRQIVTIYCWIFWIFRATQLFIPVHTRRRMACPTPGPVHLHSQWYVHPQLFITLLLPENGKIDYAMYKSYVFWFYSEQTHDISAPTPNVSPNSNAATTDSVEDMT